MHCQPAALREVHPECIGEVGPGSGPLGSGSHTVPWGTVGIPGMRVPAQVAGWGAAQKMFLWQPNFRVPAQEIPLYNGVACHVDSILKAFSTFWSMYVDRIIAYLGGSRAGDPKGGLRRMEGQKLLAGPRQGGLRRMEGQKLLAGPRQGGLRRMEGQK